MTYTRVGTNQLQLPQQSLFCLLSKHSLCSFWYLFILSFLPMQLTGTLNKENDRVTCEKKWKNVTIVQWKVGAQLAENNDIIRGLRVTLQKNKCVYNVVTTSSSRQTKIK